MTTVEAVVQVKETDSGWTLTETFVASPIRIGRDRRNGVCLPHPAVATFHGEVAFTATGLAFRNLSRISKSLVDGVDVPPFDSVTLKQLSEIAIGPFRIEVRLQTVSLADVDVNVANDTGIALAVERPNGHSRQGFGNGAGVGLRLHMWPARPSKPLRAALSTDMAARAAGMLALFSAAFLKLEHHLMPPGTAPLLLPDGPADIVEYLLDPVQASAAVLEQVAEALDTLVTAAAARSGSSGRVVPQ